MARSRRSPRSPVARTTERLTHRDFGDLSRPRSEQVRRLIDRMVWRPADAPSRRWGPRRTGTRPDLRRTLRSLTGPQGDLVPLALIRRAACEGDRSW